MFLNDLGFWGLGFRVCGLEFIGMQDINRVFGGGFRSVRGFTVRSVHGFRVYFMVSDSRIRNRFLIMGGVTTVTFPLTGVKP